MKRKTKNNEHGVALILVLGIMAVMIGIALTFASSMRLTEKTAKNYYYSMQAMYAARAGMHHAIHYLKNDVRPNLAGPANDASGALDSIDAISDHLNELWNNEFVGTDQYLEQNFGHAEAVGSRWIILTQPNTVSLGHHIYSRYAVLVKDEAGKVNFNAGSNYPASSVKQGTTTAELNIQRPFEHDSFTTAMANAIISYRYGPDGAPGLSGEDDNKNNNAFAGALNDGVDNEPAMPIDDPGEGVDEPSEFCPYDPLYSDDRPYHTVDDINATKINSGLTPAIFKNIEDDITVFSRERQQYLDSFGEWHNQVSLSFPQSFTFLRDFLVGRGVADDAAKALAIIDYADTDAIPTYINSTAYGIEGLSISEIMARPYVWFTTVANEPFDETAGVGSWSWNSGSGQLESTSPTSGASTAVVDLNLIRKGKYNIYVESYDDSNSSTDNSFTIRISDTAAGSSNDYVTGGHGAGDFSWQHLGTFDFTTNNPAQNRIELQKTAASTLSALRQIVFSQEGNVSTGTGSSTDDCDYLEIRNISRRSIDMAGWRIEVNYANSSVDNFTIPTIAVGDTSKYHTTVVPGGGFLCLVRDAATTGVADDTGSTAIAGTAEGTADGINFENTWGDASGMWGDDGDVVEKYPIVPVPGLRFFGDIEIDSIVLYANQPFANPTNINGVADRFSYTTLSNDNKSMERVTPFAWENHNFIAVDAEGGSPGKPYTGDLLVANSIFTGNPFKGTNWAIKDGPFSTKAELLDIIFGCDTSSNTILTMGNSDLIRLADVTTVSYFKLEAEDVVDAPTGTLVNGSSPYGSSSRYMFPTGSTLASSFLWTSGTIDDVGADDINYIAKGYYDLHVSGEPGNTVTVTIPSHANTELSYVFDVTTVGVTPGPSTIGYVGKIKTVPDLLAYKESSLKVNVADDAATAGNSYLDYIVLTPGAPMSGKINLNTVTKSRILSALPGVSDAQATAIIANRPYQNHAEFINEVASNTGSLRSSFTLDEYRLFSELITFNSDVYEILVKGQVYYEYGGVVKILGEQIIQAVIDREPYRRDDDVDGEPDGPVKTIYYRLLK